MILVLYVDDFMIIVISDQLILHCKEGLVCEFDIKDIGLLHYFLGHLVGVNFRAM